MSEWFDTLEGLLGHAWREMARGARDAQAPTHLVVLASVGDDGGARARTVALRHADRAADIVELHTDVTTPKVAELRANPRAALHLWLPDDVLQIRLRGTVEVRTEPAADADWAEVPRFSRGNYGVVPAPGTPIPRPDAYDRQPDRAKFAVLHLTVDDIDLVHLGETYHRRARYRRQDGWAGHWLAP